MLNQRLSAARKVAASLFEAENEIDSAVTSTTGLINSIIEARAEAKLPAVIGQDALDSLGAAISSLIQSRRQIIEAHQGLDVASQQIGLGAVAWGDQFPKPPPSTGQLRSVA